MKVKDPKYLKSFRDCICFGCWLNKEICTTDTVVAHHLVGRLRDDLTLPAGLFHHTEGKEAMHNGKKTWYENYLNKEECIELAEFAYNFWVTNKINLFSLDNIDEVLKYYFVKH